MGHVALPILQPQTLPGPQSWGRGSSGGFSVGLERSLLMASFCRTSWLLAWAKLERSGMSHRQVSLYLPQRGTLLPGDWHGKA